MRGAPQPKSGQEIRRNVAELSSDKATLHMQSTCFEYSWGAVKKPFFYTLGTPRVPNLDRFLRTLGMNFPRDAVDRQSVLCFRVRELPNSTRTVVFR